MDEMVLASSSGTQSSSHSRRQAGGLASAYGAGDMVGADYRLRYLIGQGGMGTVFRAHHVLLNSDYALKILRPELITPANWLRFQVEAQILSKLDHPNIVQIYNMGVDRERSPFYVMELVSGASLAEEIRRGGRMSINRAAAIFIPVASALAFSHRHGVIHCDIKPSNVMLVGDKNSFTGAKIVDFGIAKTQQLAGYDGQSLTTTGEISGTPHYISPECIAGAHADARSDIYSLGCTIFQALTGAPPFHGATVMHTLMMHQNAPVPTLASVNPGAEYSERLESFIAKLLAKDPDQRCQDMDEVQAYLRRLSSSGQTAGSGRGKLIVVQQWKHRNVQGSGNRSQFASRPHSNRSQKMVLGLVAGVLIGGLLCSFNSLGIGAPKPIKTAALIAPLSDSLTLYVNKSLMGSEKFSCGIVNTRSGPRYTFRFPKDLSVGFIDYSPPKNGRIAARGDVSIPIGERLALKLDANVGDMATLERFNSDEFSELRVSPQNIRKLTATICKWTKLKMLTMDFFVVGSETDLFCLDQLKTVPDFNLSHCAIPTRAFSRLALLNRLESLGIEAVRDVGARRKNVDDLFLSLGRCHNLKRLYVDQVTLTHQIVREIAASDSIDYLVIGSSDSHSVLSDQDIKALSTMPSLANLRIGNARLSPRSIDYFKRFGRLHQLTLAEQDWNPEDKKRLAALFVPGKFLFIKELTNGHGASDI